MKPKYTKSGNVICVEFRRYDPLPCSKLSLSEALEVMIEAMTETIKPGQYKGKFDELR